MDADSAGYSLRLKALWKYRDLLYLLARRDVVTVYKQTILGPLWYILQPLLTSLLFVVIFSRVARLPTDGVPPMLFYLAGNVFWSFFAEALRGTSDSYVLNANLFQKVYFPRAIVPLAKVLAGYVQFAIQLLLLAGFFCYFYLATDFTPTIGVQLLAVLPLAIGASLLALGIGLLLSSLTYKYRDLQYFVVFAVQLAMYATPVIYPLSAVPEDYLLLVLLNPMSSYVEGFRAVVLDTGGPPALGYFYSVAITLLTLAAGLLAFNRAERTFADTV